MITILSKADLGRHVSSLYQMHRLRKEVFSDRLGWSVAVSGDLEVDEYDALAPVYVLSTTTSGDVLGGVRLLPTVGPYMLRNTFGALLNGVEAPESDVLWEASRFAVAKNSAKGEDGLAFATYELLIGVLQFSLAQDLEAIVCVVDVRMERVLRRAGWNLQRLGAARRIGSTVAVAGRLEVSARLLCQLQASADRSQGDLASSPVPIEPGRDVSPWDRRPMHWPAVASAIHVRANAGMEPPIAVGI
jgi:N-acyl-L-homoserine lactone synthetase